MFGIVLFFLLSLGAGVSRRQHRDYGHAVARIPTYITPNYREGTHLGHVDNREQGEMATVPAIPGG